MYPNYTKQLVVTPEQYLKLKDVLDRSASAADRNWRICQCLLAMGFDPTAYLFQETQVIVNRYGALTTADPTFELELP